MPRLTRAKKREIREAVGKACAARVRTTPLQDILQTMDAVTSAEILYAEKWRETLADGMVRSGDKSEEHLLDKAEMIGTERMPPMEYDEP
jgi:hypothetical protein